MNFFFLTILISFFIKTFPVKSQHITGVYSASTPEASMFFLNPGYMNPAVGNGALGIHTNPASLNRIHGTELAFAFQLAQSSQGDFTFEAVESSDVYDPISFDTRMEIKEPGGIAAIGMGHRFGNWRLGLAVSRARKGGFSIQAQGSVDTESHFQVDQPITQDQISNLPVDEIPVTWDVNSTITVGLSSEPTELYLSVLPIMAGLSYNAGPLSLGVGFQYFDISSSNKRALLTSSVTGSGTISGSPSGIDPVTGQNWTGTLTADFTIDDQPLIADYTIDISGNRMALSLGGMLHLGAISLGATYTHGFPGSITGSYDLSTIRTIGIPDDIELDQVELDLTNSPNISGHTNIQLADFVKDTLDYQDQGDINLGSYEEYALGIKFSIFGLFAGVNFPSDLPDLRSIYGGLYMDFKIPALPVRLNTGVIHRSDAIEGDEDEFIPYRVVTHVGAGLAIQLGSKPYWLRFGVRSSLTELVLENFEENSEKTLKNSLPSIFDNLAFSCGLEIPLR